MSLIQSYSFLLENEPNGDRKENCVAALTEESTADLLFGGGDPIPKWHDKSCESVKSKFMCQAIFEHQCEQILNPSLAIPPPCFDYESGDFDRDVEGCSPLREIAEEALPPNHNTATVNLFHTIIS